MHAPQLSRRLGSISALSLISFCIGCAGGITSSVVAAEAAQQSPATRAAESNAATTARSTPAAAPETRPATQPTDAGPAAQLPYTLTRFAREGPITGVAVKLDLSNPRVHVVTALTNEEDPDGAGPAVGKLDTMVAAADRHDLEIAMNASFFAVTGSRVVAGKKVGYFVGNGGHPQGWLRVDGRTLTEPKRPELRTCVVVHEDGRVTLQENATVLPPDARYAVSGNAKVLTKGEPTPSDDKSRHPRSAVGLSADGKTLILLAVDGRRAGVSRGVTLAEEAALLKEFGASEGINLDGGGSTALVIKDAVTGAHAIANRPSEKFSLAPELDSVQRPVIDLIGVQIDDD